MIGLLSKVFWHLTHGITEKNCNSGYTSRLCIGESNLPFGCQILVNQIVTVSGHSFAGRQMIKRASFKSYSGNDHPRGESEKAKENRVCKDSG